MDPRLSDWKPSEDLRKAVAHFWLTRGKQAKNQKKRKRTDQGTRGSVTGGAQLDGFIDAVVSLLHRVGVEKDHIFLKTSIELPGYFRPTKKWDLIVVRDGQLLAALEAKSQVGSFGNNVNNRAEEAIGSAEDLWTAYREGAFNKSAQPWLGYIFLLEDCVASRKPVKVNEPHFPVFPEFRGASYMVRYELLCKRLVRERKYNATACVISELEAGLKGKYSEPNPEITYERLCRSLLGHLAAQA